MSDDFKPVHPSFYVMPRTTQQTHDVNVDKIGVSRFNTRKDLEAFESKTPDLHDFYFTGDDYRFRFDVEAKQRFIDLIREQFNSGVICCGRVLKWDTIIEKKTNELGRFLETKSSAIDLTEPAPRLDRSDDREMRAKILCVTQSETARLGINKSTLHYLRAHARRDSPFRVYNKVMMRLR